MSRIEKLKSLLARVEQRRTEPRLVAVSGGHGQSSANTNLATPAQSRRDTPLELAPKAPTPALAPPPPFFARAPEGALRPSIEEAFSPSAPSSIPPPSIHEAETKLRSSLPPPTRSIGPSSTVPPSAQPPVAPASADLRSRAEEPRAADLRSRAEEPRASDLRSRAEEPRASTHPAARSTTDVQPAVPSRIAPSPPLPFDSAVRVTSSPRPEPPKTFGDLLEQSLALRPKSG